MSGNYTFMYVSTTAFVCNKERVLVQEDPVREINATYETYVPLQGDPETNETVEAITLDMS